MKKTSENLKSDNKTVYIIGHKNPDTDSGVSAVAYAELKHLLGFPNYVAARAGLFSPQTEYVFNRFEVPFPKYVPDVIPKVEYFMDPNCDTVHKEVSVWEAIGSMDRAKERVLLVTDDDGTYRALLHYNVFAQNVLTVMDPEQKTAFPTTIALIAHTLNAQPIVMKNEHDVFKASVRVGASTLETLHKKIKEHESEDIVVIVGDKDEIIEASIDAKVKLVILTSGHSLKKEFRAKAEANDVSVIISPYTTSASSMLIAYATPVSEMADYKTEPVHISDTIAKIRPLLQKSPARCLPVIDDNKKVIGLISEHGLLQEPNIELVLVDHNEIEQAVDGAENYRIREVIDHHRLGTLSTDYPITFIAKPIGSTSTLMANSFREHKVPLPKNIASILLCGILSDTLILQSATTTDIDRDTASYLSDITNLDIQTLGKEVLAAGSKVSGRSAKELVNQDMKEYSHGKLMYTVSQIEVSNTQEIIARKKEFLDELSSLRSSHKAVFSSLLVTDITQLSSLLFLQADEKFLQFVTFPKMDESIYILKDVVSRKKQLVPMMAEQMTMFAQG